jgi:hypothetical protein
VSKIFISYRRSDTEIAAGRLARDLRSRFGDDAIFRDKDSIDAGADWVEAIRSAIGRKGLVLVLIGERWLQDTNVVPGASTTRRTPTAGKYWPRSRATAI